MASLDALFDELMAVQAARKLPPVANWHPAHEGTIDIRIAADGIWYHEGTPIVRQPLVRLFSTILRRDPDGFCLVTPAERLMIVVDDAPFLAVDVEVRGRGRTQELLFVTNVDDYVLAGASHPIRVSGNPDRPRPYIMVRDGLEALIARQVFYRLVDLCEPGPDGDYWLWSAAERFHLG